MSSIVATKIHHYRLQVAYTLFQLTVCPIHSTAAVADPQLCFHGDTYFTPPISLKCLEKSIEERVGCSKHSPFSDSRPRMATGTSHFGDLEGNS